MTPLRFLPLCLFATFAVPAIAQSAAPATPAPSYVTPLQFLPPSTPLPAVSAAAPAVKLPPTFSVPRSSQALVAITNPGGPCFALRTYNFKPNDLKANLPKPSSMSSCTPAASNSFKLSSGPVLQR